MGDSQNSDYRYFEDAKQTYFCVSLKTLAAVAKQCNNEMLCVVVSDQEKEETLETFLAVTREDIKSPPAAAMPYPRSCLLLALGLHVSSGLPWTLQCHFP